MLSKDAACGCQKLNPDGSFSCVVSDTPLNPEATCEYEENCFCAIFMFLCFTVLT
jgi:hypothetical protein